MPMVESHEKSTLSQTGSKKCNCWENQSIRKQNRMDRYLSLPKPTKDTRYLSEIIYDEIKRGKGKADPLIIEGYIPEEKCYEIIRYYNSRKPERRTYQGEVNFEYRDSEFVKLPALYFDLLTQFIKEKMAAHFLKEENSFELIQPVIYRYGKGIGFKPHHDMVTDLEIERCRKKGFPIIGGDYTVILMLNCLHASQGGQLHLLDGNIEIQQKTGTIIAFRVDAVHEVYPILEGQRYSMVCRYICK